MRLEAQLRYTRHDRSSNIMKPSIAASRTSIQAHFSLHLGAVDPTGHASRSILLIDRPMSTKSAKVMLIEWSIEDCRPYLVTAAFLEAIVVLTRVLRTQLQ